MLTMIHSRQYNIDTGYVDKNKRLRLSNLFLMFQEIAEEHAEILGIGKDKVIEAGRKWIITRHGVKINRLPSFGEKVTLYTYPGKYNPFFLYRHFYLKDKDDNILLTAISIWAVLDAKTNKIIVNPFDVKLPEGHQDFELSVPSKIEDDPKNKVKDYVIQYSDIDLNGHLNNTRYLELVQNVHDSSFYLNHEFASVLINYFSEIKEGETVNLYSDLSDKQEIIKGSVNDRDCFKAIITYK